MAVSQIEEKILGRLAKQTEPSNALLSSHLYQVLGLSILLSKKLYRARKLRRLDITRDTKSLQLYHHIIWLAREGLSITEVFILPYCQNGEQGPECRVMAAKLRASFYHTFCLFHNHPPVSQLSRRSLESLGSTTSSARTTRGGNGQTRNSHSRSPKNGSKETNGSKSRRRSGKSALRDPIPSMTSETSYVTNPYAAGPSHTPPVPRLPSLPPDARRTPTRPPGLTPINIPATQAAASFLLPPLNFVPMAREHFDTAQHLANTHLPPTHALRLSVSLEHAAFTWDCEREHERARRIARRIIKEVYASSDGLDDEEFADASSIVQALGGIIKRESNESTPRPTSRTPSPPKSSVPKMPVRQAPPIDRTIAVSPSDRRNKNDSPVPIRSIPRPPERLATVPEVESINESPSRSTRSPPTSRLSDGSRQQQQRRTSSASDKSSKRRAAEQAEEELRRRNSSTSHRHRSTPRSSPPHSRQTTPPEGYVKAKKA